MNHYPRHVGDFIRDTVGLTLAERGAYTALLDQYYANEKPLPLDVRERYRMAGASSKADRAAVDYVVHRYFTEHGDGWHQKRADQEIAAYQARANSARKNGRFGGRPRTETITEEKPTRFSDGSEKKANQEPVTSNQNQRSKTTPPPRKRGVPLPPEFGISEQVREWAEDKGHGHLSEHLESFICKAKSKDYRYVDWDQALMVAIRDNWAGIGKNGGGAKPTLAERRAANMDAITGRTRNERTIDADSVDRALVRQTVGYLRKPDDGDVG